MRSSTFLVDIPPVLSLACGDTGLSELGILIPAWPHSPALLLPHLYLLHLHPGSDPEDLLHRGAEEGLLHLCLHLTVVIVHYGCASFMYLRPKASYSLERDQLIAVTYTVVTPLLNPIIYSLRNRAVQTALRNAFQGGLLGKG